MRLIDGGRPFRQLVLTTRRIGISHDLPEVMIGAT